MKEKWRQGKNRGGEVAINMLDNWSRFSTQQETPSPRHSYQKAGEKQEGSPSENLEQSAAAALIQDSWLPQTREQLSAVLSHFDCGHLLVKPLDNITSYYIFVVFSFLTSSLHILKNFSEVIYRTSHCLY